MESLGIVAMLAAVLLVPGATLLAAMGASLPLPSRWLAAPVAAVLSLGVLSCVLAIVLLLHGSMVHVLAGVAAVTVTLAVVTVLRPPLRRDVRRRREGTALVALAVIASAVLGWIVQAALFSDTLYHVAQGLKLARLDHIGLQNTLQFKDGSAHPGYLLPTFQAWLGTPMRWFDPLRVAQLVPIVTLPIATLAAAGLAETLVSRPRAAAAGAWAWIAVAALGTTPAFRPAMLAAYGGVFVLVTVIPVIVALVVDALRTPTVAGLALVSGATVLVGVLHVSYLAMLAVPMLAITLGWAWSRPGTPPPARRLALVLGVVFVSAIAIGGVLAPQLAKLDTFLQDASNVQQPGEGSIERSNADEVKRMLVGNDHRFHLRADIVVETGGVALVALLASIVAGVLLWRRVLGWLVLGGTTLVLVGLLWAPAFTRLSAVMGIDQARRLGEALPLALGLVALTEVLVNALRWATLGRKRIRTPVVAGAIILLAAAAAVAVARVPALVTRGGEPVLDQWPIVATVIVAGTATLMLFVGALVRAIRRRRFDSITMIDDAPLAPLAAIPLFAIVVASLAMAWGSLGDHLDAHASGVQQGEMRAFDSSIRDELASLPPGSLVLSDTDQRTSYRVMAVAPVYVVGAPPGHVANTSRNRIMVRVRLTRLLMSPKLDAAQRQAKLDDIGVDAIVVRRLPRYEALLADLDGPLADEWTVAARNDDVVVYRRASS